VIADIWTVTTKEWREYVILRGSARGGLLGLLVFAGFIGVVMPVELGASWVDTPIAIVSAFWLPLVLVLSVIGDSFAGERERHTLETLLATRLPDRAILLGKMAAAVGYGWALTLIATLLGLLAVNLVHGHGRLLLFRPLAGLGIAEVSLLGAALTAGAGGLVSLRSATVREAQQRLSIAVMGVFFGLLIGLQAMPRAWLNRLGEAILGAGEGPLLLVVGLLLGLVDVALLVALAIRFRRARLILD